MASYILHPTSCTAASTLLAVPSESFLDAVNKGPTTFDDTSYVYNQYMFSSADGYYYFDEPSATGTISEVKIYFRSKIITSGSNTYNVGAIISGTTYMKTTTNVTLTGYFNYNQSFTSNPATGVAWVWADFVSIRFVYKMVSLVSAANILGSAFWVEIVYTPTATTYFLRNKTKVKQIP